MPRGKTFRERAEHYGVPYEEGITRKGVLARAEWQCQMDKCLLETKAIDKDLKRDGLQGVIPEAYGTVDHIVPLGAPNSPGHVWTNVRAAHSMCNREDEAAVALRPPPKPAK